MKKKTKFTIRKNRAKVNRLLYERSRLNKIKLAIEKSSSDLQSVDATSSSTLTKNADKPVCKILYPIVRLVDIVHWKNIDKSIFKNIPKDDVISDTRTSNFQAENSDISHNSCTSDLHLSILDCFNDEEQDKLDYEPDDFHAIEDHEATRSHSCVESASEQIQEVQNEKYERDAETQIIKNSITEPENIQSSVQVDCFSDEEQAKMDYEPDEFIENVDDEASEGKQLEHEQKHNEHSDSEEDESDGESSDEDDSDEESSIISNSTTEPMDMEPPVNCFKNTVVKVSEKNHNITITRLFSQPTSNLPNSQLNGIKELNDKKLPNTFMPSYRIPKKIPTQIRANCSDFKEQFYTLKRLPKPNNAKKTNWKNFADEDLVHVTTQNDKRWYCAIGINQSLPGTDEELDTSTICSNFQSCQNENENIYEKSSPPSSTQLLDNPDINIKLHENVQITPPTVKSSNSGVTRSVSRSSNNLDLDKITEYIPCLFPKEDMIRRICQKNSYTICDDTKCSKCHSLLELFNDVKLISQDNSLQAHSSCNGNDYCFSCVFKCFLDHAMKSRNAEAVLIDMINDVFNALKNNFVDKTTYVQNIVESLQTIGLSFKQAIHHIILKYGTSQTAICDILFYIISEKKEEIDLNWELVQKITCCRYEKLDAFVVTKILKNALSRKKTSVISHINRDIVKKNLVEVEKIPSDLMDHLLRQEFNAPLSEFSGDPSYSLISNMSNSNSMSPSCESFDNLSQFNKSLLGVSYSNANIPWEKNDYFVETRIEKVIPVPSTSTFDSQSIGSDKKLNIYDKPLADTDERLFVMNSPIVLDRSMTPANIIAHPAKQIILHPKYKCNKSLHNLMPEMPIQTLKIDNLDIITLQTALEMADANIFLKLMQKYSNITVIEDFIVNILVLFKKMRASKIKEILQKLFSRIENIQPNYRDITPIRVILEVILMNSIHHFQKAYKMEMGRDILNYSRDWHSLLTSKIFPYNKNANISHMARYISLIQMLIEAKDIHNANELLQCRSLKLVEPPTKWPYKYKSHDVKERNRVVVAFMEDGAAINMIFVNDFLKHVVAVVGGVIEGVDVWKTWNEIIVDLLDGERKNPKSSLYLFTNDILKVYWKFLDKDVLQSLLFYLQYDLSLNVMLNLFKSCVKRGIYKDYNGSEDTITIPLNITDLELSLIFKSYFENILNGKVLKHDFLIEFEIPKSEVPSSPRVLRNNIVVRSLISVFKSVLEILMAFNIKIDHAPSHTIRITRDMQSGIRDAYDFMR